MQQDTIPQLVPTQNGAHKSGPRWSVSLPVSIRICTEDDLGNLEWFGIYWQHREIFQNAYERQLAGENLMLLADMNGFPVGQIWIDLTRAPGTGYFWAVRVFPFLQNKGIGRRLLDEAERILVERGYHTVELSVEKDNVDALRFYRRMGYRMAGHNKEELEFTRPDGQFEHVHLDEWLLRKDLTASGGDGAVLPL